MHSESAWCDAGLKVSSGALNFRAVNFGAERYGTLQVPQDRATCDVRRNLRCPTKLSGPCRGDWAERYEHVLMSSQMTAGFLPNRVKCRRHLRGIPRHGRSTSQHGVLRAAVVSLQRQDHPHPLTFRGNRTGSRRSELRDPELLRCEQNLRRIAGCEWSVTERDVLFLSDQARGG